MFRKLLATAGTLGALAAAPVFASPCTDQIDALERRLDETAAAAGSASSGGQAVAAARQGQAMEARDRGDRSAGAPAVPFQSENREAQATQRATEAGGGGDRVMQGKATLNRARSLDAQGDGAGCMQAVEEVRRQIGN
jgi:hypothetical protein